MFILAAGTLRKEDSFITSPLVARAPDGNGGLYWALHNQGILDDMDKRGVTYLHAYCVDNVLVKVADPIFMGYAISRGAESANKVVEKAFPTEAVGVVCRLDGKIQVVEYSEISTKTAELRTPNGKLQFRAGNICNHFFTAEFLRRVSQECDHLLPYHVAKKAIPYVSTATGVDKPQTVKPSEPNGIKLEKFVFDAFQFSTKFVVWECQREEEFSPLKNSDNPKKKDTPQTARESLYKLHSAYVERAGGRIKGSADGPSVCEISPLLSYAGENLESVVGDKVFESPVCLDVVKDNC